MFVRATYPAEAWWLLSAEQQMVTNTCLGCDRAHDGGRRLGLRRADRSQGCCIAKLRGRDMLCVGRVRILT